MSRKEVAATAARVIQQHRHDKFTPLELASAILDKVEGMIRDDQRGFDIRQQVAERDDFRAKVEALPHARGRDGSGGQVWRSDVLALIDGGSDE